MGAKGRYSLFTFTEIPLFDCPLNLTNHGSSAWAYSYRIDVENEDQMESYFMKVNFLKKIFPFALLIHFRMKKAAKRLWFGWLMFLQGIVRRSW